MINATPEASVYEAMSLKKYKYTYTDSDTYTQ